ncbi:hypothetical protein LXJ56_25280, partial [Escherichia coli]|nr:hypothetical protein [Escherichia coli]
AICKPDDNDRFEPVRIGRRFRCRCARRPAFAGGRFSRGSGFFSAGGGPKRRKAATGAQRSHD